MKITSCAPARISFGGGGTDVSPFTEEYGGAVLNATISKCVYSVAKKNNFWRLGNINRNIFKTYDSISDLTYNGKLDLLKSVIRYFKPSTKFEINTYSEVAFRSGLGGSASAFVSAIGIFNYLLKDKRMDPYEIAELAYSLERNELKIPGGRQDQYAAVFGGINFIEFKGKDWVKVVPLNISKKTINELEKNLILIHLGNRKNSEDILKDQIKQVENKKNVNALLKNKEIAYEMKRALIRNDLVHFGVLLDTAWQYKKKYSRYISNKYIDDLYTFVKENGALGGKVTGAGGGGHMIVYATDEHVFKLKSKLRQKGFKLVDFKFDFNGLRVWQTDGDDIDESF